MKSDQLVDAARSEPKKRPVTRARAIDPEKLVAARARRKDPTSSEERAWQIVRDRRLLGLKFRREQPVEGFCLDLYCAELRLCIEIDGSVHDEPERADSDSARTDALALHGIRVARIPANRITRASLEAVVQPFLAPSSR